MLRREALLLLGGGPFTSVASLSAARPPRLGETYDAAGRLGKGGSRFIPHPAGNPFCAPRGA